MTPIALFHIPYAQSLFWTFLVILIGIPVTVAWASMNGRILVPVLTFALAVAAVFVGGAL